MILTPLVYCSRSNLLSHYERALKIKNIAKAFLLITIYFINIIKVLIAAYLLNTMRT